MLGGYYLITLQFQNWLTIGLKLFKEYENAIFIKLLKGRYWVHREHFIPRKKWLISNTSGCALAEVIAIITIELRASCILLQRIIDQ